MESNLPNIEAALRSGDESQVKAALQKYLAVDDVTQAEKGEVYAKLALMYMEFKTEMNERNSEAFGLVEQALKKLAKEKNDFDQSVELGNVRKTLQ